MIWAVLGFTGAFGFSVSYALLYFGVSAMWIRYPMAVLGGYMVFLGLLRMWVEWERDQYKPENEPLEVPVSVEGGSVQLSKSSNWLELLDMGDFLIEPEGCLSILGFLSLCAGAVVLVMTLLNAEALIAEGFIDTFLVVGLYRRMRLAAREHWLGGMVRKTWGLAVVIAMLLGFCGYLLQQYAPGAKSIGPAVQILLRGY